MARPPPAPARRRLLATGTAALALMALPARAAPAAGIFVVSRERILREAAAARRLREAETTMTATLQDQIDRTKSAFAAEERELTRLRGELPAADFEARVADFDHRVRLARRNAQERAGELQKAFQEARAEIAAGLPGLMERLRTEAGASVIVNAEQALAYDPSVDLTDRAIALFDAEGPSPPVPEIDLSAPLSPPPAEPAPAPDSPAR